MGLPGQSDEPVREAKLAHHFPQPIMVDSFEDFGQVHRGSEEVEILFYCQQVDREMQNSLLQFAEHLSNNSQVSECQQMMCVRLYAQSNQFYTGGTCKHCWEATPILKEDEAKSQSRQAITSTNPTQNRMLGPGGGLK